MLEHKIPTAIIANSETEVKEIAAEIKDLDEISLVGGVACPQQALSLVNSYAPHLLLVDVNIDDSCGLEFIQLIHQKNIFPEVVLMGEGDSQAYDALNLKPLDFLIKPVRKQEIKKVLERLKFKLKREELKRKMDIYARSFNVSVKRVFQQSKGVIILNLDEILSCKAERSKTILTLINDEEVVLKTNLTETIETINDQRFFKISRSYCINRNYLRKIDKKKSRCLMYYEGNAWEIPASRNSIKRLESFYTKPVY